MSYEDEVNKTYSKAYSKNQYLPKVIKDRVNPNATVLDFGAGKDAFGTAMLREAGFTRVRAWEVGDNFVVGIHDADAIKKKYQVVFASNVLNVQPSEDSVITVLLQVRKLLCHKGTFYCNYPDKPNHPNILRLRVEGLLRLAFEDVEKLKDVNGNHVWKCRAR